MTGRYRCRSRSLARSDRIRSASDISAICESVRNSGFAGKSAELRQGTGYGMRTSFGTSGIDAQPVDNKTAKVANSLL